MKSLSQKLFYFVVFMLGSIIMASCHDMMVLMITESHPVVSPDGQRIAYNFYVEATNLEDYPPSGLYVMTIDGKGKKLLVPYDSIGGLYETAICWSPDGRQVATNKGIYTIKNNMVTDYRPKNNDAGYSIYIMSSDGTNQRMLDTGLHPAWAPDSKYIVYSKEKTIKRNKVRFDIWKISIDGKEKMQITK